MSCFIIDEHLKLTVVCYNRWMQAQNEQNLIKSIIYGNLVQNTYGIMRALCSAITNKDHIDKIILFLRNNHNFQKYNKFIYAFRLEQTNHHLFLTQDAPTHKFLEGYNDDTGLEGNGEKLLSLLQKFNVRNVLVIVAIRQKDSLREFNAEHYVQIVKCAKDLLSSLYDKVVLSKSQEPSVIAVQVEKTPLQPKQYVIPLQEYKKVPRPIENPNYVGQQHLKRVIEPSLRDKRQPEITFLDAKIKELAGILQQIIQKFGENEDAQANFAIKYDKNKRVGKVFNLLAKLFDFKSKEELLNDNMSHHLRSITSRNLTAATIRTLNEQLMSDKQLRAESIAKENKICGILLEFLEVLLKSYAFAKKLAMIESQIEDKQDQEQGEIDQTLSNQEG